MKRIFLFLLTCLTAGISFAQSKDSVYMFSYFINNGADGLHFAWSDDGLKWQSLLNDSPVVRPTVSKDKLMRDPCILRGADGKFHMVWTVSWNDRGIGYASSTDLTHWSEQQFVPVMQHEDSARNAWAPEISYDPQRKQYMIYWSTTIRGKYASDPSVENGYNHRIYYTLTKDFKTYTQAKLLYDHGFNVIDATIVPNGGSWIMLLKDETPKPVPQKNIRIATAKKIEGPYTEPSSPITGNYWAEGPTAAKIGNRWIVYFDKYRDHKYGAVASHDLEKWTDISNEISFPKGARHGTVFVISRSEFRTFFGQQ